MSWQYQYLDAEIEHITRRLAELRMLATIPTIMVQGGEIVHLEVWNDDELKKVYGGLSKILGELMALRLKYRYEKVMTQSSEKDRT